MRYAVCVSNRTHVLAGLGPAIHEKPLVDPRAKPGEDELGCSNLMDLGLKQLCLGKGRRGCPGQAWARRFKGSEKVLATDTGQPLAAFELGDEEDFAARADLLEVAGLVVD